MHWPGGSLQSPAQMSAFPQSQGSSRLRPPASKIKAFGMTERCKITVYSQSCSFFSLRGSLTNDPCNELTRSNAGGQAKGLVPPKMGAQLLCMGWAWSMAGHRGHHNLLGPVSHLAVPSTHRLDTSTPLPAGFMGATLLRGHPSLRASPLQSITFEEHPP